MAIITKQFTFSPGETIIASEHNFNFDTIYNDYNGNITNPNVAANAAIEETKLDLSTITQNITFTGTLDFTTSTVTGLTSDFILLNETTAPSTTANQGALYTKEVDGQTELFFREESSGTEVQITNAGILNGSGATQVFKADGTFTAPAGVTTVYLSMVGGGGSGASSSSTTGSEAGGGGGAGVINFPYTVIPGNDYDVVVGDGGLGVISGGDPGDPSSFDSTVTVQGGEEGAGTTTQVGGLGGNPLHGDAVDNTAVGLAGIPGGNGGDGNGGDGGGSIFGEGALGAVAPQNPGFDAAANTGAGGGGSFQGGVREKGGNGGSGIVIVML